MRAPVDRIAAPQFPPRLEWLGGRAHGFPMLLEFWDFCRVQSLRTLPYVKAWNERYDELKVVGVHAAGFPPSREPAAVRAAVARLAVPYPVAVDADYEVWGLYGNRGWPARYLFDRRGMLLHYHYGEGGYGETELAIQELLGREQPVLPFRPEEAPDALLVPQTDDVEGPTRGRTRPAACGRCSTGAGWSRSTAPRSRSTSGCVRADRARAEHRRRARARGRRRRHVLRGVLHARSSRLTSSGGPSSPTIAANPGR